METGMIFDIQRYSLNDGGGIRTIVFFKGCPLDCKWCSNPESKRRQAEIIFWKNRCIGCGKCVEACPVKKGCKPQGEAACTLCMRCTEACPAKALRRSGEEMTVAQVMKVVRRDAVFYRHSGGGVTLSGGEPLMQWEFAAALAAELQANLFDVAIETTGCAKWEHAWAVFRHCDRILFDVKFMDNAKHKQLTGVDNGLILENAAKLAETGKEVIYRVPLMQDYNADEENILALVALAKKNNVKQIHLLPYHEYAKPKYEALGLEYTFCAHPPKEAHMEKLKALITAHGLGVLEGG
ncbi:glycyl-radical enzyme activating protein [Christensenellaceae bacterium OttesenSCG-928-K19]|nr:glycyl-radical enzyme activating protein [Christensenellaceae bacterium OttesenSCG-928-K19]